MYLEKITRFDYLVHLDELLYEIVRVKADKENIEFRLALGIIVGEAIQNYNDS